MVRTEIGECAITFNGVVYEFRPTFKNIRKICPPDELADLFVDICGRIKQKISVADGFGFSGASELLVCELREKCVKVMRACCDTQCTKLTSSDKDFPTWSMAHIAASLLKSGVIGAEKSDRSGSSPKSIVDVYEFVDIARHHFEMPKSEAEMLTKTEFDRQYKVKFPETKKKGRAPTMEEHRHNMRIMREMEAKRYG